MLVFDPASEFEIIENIDFEEEVQRPEELRFFTLDEQLLDYFDKVLPKKKHITKYEYQTIANEVERIREVYTRTITLTDTDYRVDTSRKDVHVDWVFPIYEPFTYTPYSYTNLWSPLFEKGVRRQPNIYPRLLTALPRPYKTTSTSGVPLQTSAVVVNEEGLNAIHALGTYERTKGVIHGDGSFSIVKLPIPNTEDNIRVQGFYMKKRQVEVPNPLPNHPFLESNQESKLLTNEPLKDVFPTLEAILTHGIPRTEDPYEEGIKYLKVYDVRLSDVPWSLWKERFPPAELVTTTPSPLAVSFPAPSNRVSPNKSLQDGYLIPWFTGVEPRFWLMSQEDAGTYVIKMLLSMAGDAGRVPPETPGDKPTPSFPTSTPEECFPEGSFDALLNAGVYRPPGICVPVTYIQHERAYARSAGHSAWNDTTHTEILKEHQTLLQRFQFATTKEPTVFYEKVLGKTESELRNQVLAISNDDHRTPEDKADAIEKLIRELQLTNHVYLDSHNAFVVCDHTIAELKGDLERDKDVFYRDWTAIEDGFRVCKYCGERISADVFIAQDDFDDQGHVIKMHEVLPESTFHGETHGPTFAMSLREFQGILDLNNTGEAIFYLLLSALQVLPTESQVRPILENIRTLTLVVRANKKIEKSSKERIEGLLGLVGIVILLQTHIPFLIPRRSFGSKGLKLTGYPRDTDDPNDSPILDLVIFVLRSMFETTGATLKGPITSLIRAILSNPKKVRTESLVYLKQAATKFAVLLQTAKERYIAPTESGRINLIQLPLIRKDTVEFEPDGKMGDETMAECSVERTKSIIVPRLPPSVTQDKIELWKGVMPSSSSIYISSSRESTLQVDVELAEVRRRMALGVPKGLKLDKLEVFLRSNTDGTAFTAFLSRILDILATTDFSQDIIQRYRKVIVYLNYHIDTSLLRDAARGFVYEFLHEVADASNKIGLAQVIQTAIQKDVVMNMILLTKEEAVRQESDLRTREREVFKQRLRQMNDTEREITKMLLDIGIAPYIITNEDREMFAKEYHFTEPETTNVEEDDSRPEEGFATPFDLVDNGDVPLTDNGTELPYDRGNYGERMERQFDQYETINAFDYEEGDGV